MQEIIGAPIAGKIIDVAEVSDPVFSSKAMGDGVAIVPSSGAIVAPVAGEVVMVAPTGHAFGIRCESGIDVLVHVGIDTVQLAGTHFDMNVAVGAKVNQGDSLGRVDLGAIAAEGYDTTTMVVITSAPNAAVLQPHLSTSVTAGEPAVTIEM